MNNINTTKIRDKSVRIRRENESYQEKEKEKERKEGKKEEKRKEEKFGERRRKPWIFTISTISSLTTTSQFHLLHQSS